MSNNRAPEGTAISTKGGLTSVGQIREDERTTGSAAVWVGGGMHGGLKVAFRDAT